MFHIPIVFEDETLLVINKPASVVVNKAESVIGETIQDWAEKKYQISKIKYQKEEEKDFYDRAGIVHRLDKETSGLLIIAKNPQVFFHLQSQFKERKVSKKYIALVHGKVAPEKGEVRASIGRLPWNRERFGILPAGKEATTKYKALAKYLLKKNFYTLLEITPLTGRTHQIRVHLKYLGHPIVGDSFYAGRKVYREDKKICPRLFLHASYLKFYHPKTGNPIELNENLPDDLVQVLAKLK